VAVLAVVLNHLWPTRLTGGYVGVDVFFVISGFLISSHLDREMSRTGRVRLMRFYARRIRRLLPAAFLVLLCCVLAAYVLLPFPRWAATAQEALASATYWENWLLAAHSVEYSNLTAAASLEQHYWSLSVEEQFYLFWPVLLLLLFRFGRRAQLAGIAVVGAASLAFSVYFTEVSRNAAYFITPVRVWEFALGALLALGCATIRPSKTAANLTSLAGVTMILAAAVLFDHGTVFPGSLALLPTVGTALIIFAGGHSGRQWHTGISSAPPVQFLGNISYSLYLWHWPLIVLAPFALAGTLDGGLLNAAHRVAILVIAVLLAWLSKVFVEDSTRTLPSGTKLTFAAMVAGMAAIALVAGGLTWTYDRHVAQAERDTLTQATGRCHGAAALAPGSGCPDPFGPAKVLAMGPVNEYWPIPPECGTPVAKYSIGDRPTTWVCDFSMGAPSPTVVWVVGDSHADQWMGPLLDLARKHRWVLNRALLGGCPFAKIAFVGYREVKTRAGGQTCTQWTAQISDAIVRDRPALVFTSFYARQEFADDGTGRSQTEQYRDGLTAYWNAWTAVGTRVVS
jgi:peptidoglycan/LPS O-acetylase OafA/YrhL